MRSVFGVVALAICLVGCGSSAASPVTARLQEFSITLGRSSVPAGQVTFNVTNGGTIVHELVVIDTDTAAGSLPVEAGVVDEDSISVVDEIESIAVGATPTLTVNLAAGHYAIICNIEGHYAAGMRTDLQVQ